MLLEVLQPITSRETDHSAISFHEPDLKHSTDKQHFHLTLMMTSAQVVETSVTDTDNSPFQDYPHPDDVTPGFKPFREGTFFFGGGGGGVMGRGLGGEGH